MNDAVQSSESASSGLSSTDALPLGYAPVNRAARVSDEAAHVGDDEVGVSIEKREGHLLCNARPACGPLLVAPTSVDSLERGGSRLGRPVDGVRQMTS